MAMLQHVLGVVVLDIPDQLNNDVTQDGSF
jgi:hypothetical protein